MVLESLLTTPSTELFQSVLLPFIFLFAVFFGTLSMINRFHNKINIVLAIAFALFALESPLFVIVKEFFITYSTYAVIIIFFVVFVAGAVNWGYGRITDTYYENVSPSQRIRKLNKDLAKEYKELDKVRGDPEKEATARQHIRRLKDELDIETGRLRH